MTPTAAGWIANIGPRQQRRRRTLGAVSLGVAIGLATWFLVSGTDPWWRLLLFVPLFGAALGLLQAKEKT